MSPTPSPSPRSWPTCRWTSSPLRLPSCTMSSRTQRPTPTRLKSLFGEDVARCVNGVTKLSKLKLHNKEVREAESMRKMLLAMIEDIRVIIVKLADRLHNLRTLDVLPRERQERIAAETVELYAPIAHRLGMGKLRAELEDLGFRYYDPAGLHRSRRGHRNQAPHQRDSFSANFGTPSNASSPTMPFPPVSRPASSGPGASTSSSRSRRSTSSTSTTCSASASSRTR